MPLNLLEGAWRLVESRAWDAQGNALPAPYGLYPMGQITFCNGRMLAALCKGDAGVEGGRAYSSYGGTYTFDGDELVTLVDLASDPGRIGSHQVRGVEFVGEGQILLKPPQRQYGASTERRELLWERIWQPGVL